MRDEFNSNFGSKTKKEKTTMIYYNKFLEESSTGITNEKFYLIRNEGTDEIFHYYEWLIT